MRWIIEGEKSTVHDSTNATYDETSSNRWCAFIIQSFNIFRPEICLHKKMPRKRILQQQPMPIYRLPLAAVQSFSPSHCENLFKCVNKFLVYGSDGNLEFKQCRRNAPNCITVNTVTVDPCDCLQYNNWELDNVSFWRWKGCEKQGKIWPGFGKRSIRADNILIAQFASCCRMFSESLLLQ